MLDHMGAQTTNANCLHSFSVFLPYVHCQSWCQLPVIMLSDQRATVSYAIDLLRAHQIRRENAFLHDKLQSWHEEMTALHTEIKNLRKTVELYNDIAGKACSLSEQHDKQMAHQTDTMEFLQQQFNTLQNDFSNSKAVSLETGDKKQAQVAVLERTLAALASEHQNAMTARREQGESIDASINKLYLRIDQKAERSVVESLERRVKALALPDPAIVLVKDSVSCIPDTFENKPPQEPRGNGL